MKKPNIIFILSDDLSYRDIGCYGQKYIKTPTIDRIADEGMICTNSYSGSSVCAPSRCALLTGKHMGHARVRENFIRAKGATRYIDSLREEDVTIANVLKNAGYKTGITGKWALGAASSDGMPTKKGFDYSFGFIDQTQAHSYYPNLIFENDKLVRIKENDGYDMSRIYKSQSERYDNSNDSELYDENGDYRVDGVLEPKKAKNIHDMMSDAALGFIERNHEEPFFLYVAYTVPHGPIIASSIKEYMDSNFPSIRHKIWASMITRMDDDINDMIKLLEKHDIYDDTIIIFASDNGYSAHAYFGQELEEENFFQNRGPFRGCKGNLYEGGIRVPFIMKWKSVIEPKTVFDLPFAFYDIMPTLADIAKTECPKDCDGISIYNAIVNKDSKMEREYLYFEFAHEQALRFEKYKAYRKHPNEPIQLYDLEIDQEESSDISIYHEDIINKARVLFNEAHEDSEVWLNPGESEADVLEKTKHLKQNRFECLDPNYLKWIKSLGYKENFDFLGLP